MQRTIRRVRLSLLPIIATLCRIYPAGVEEMDEYAVDTPAVHVQDFQAQPGPLDSVPDGWDPAQSAHHQATNASIASPIRGLWCFEVQHITQLVDGERAFDRPGRVVQTRDRLRRTALR